MSSVHPNHLKWPPECAPPCSSPGPLEMVRENVSSPHLYMLLAGNLTTPAAAATVGSGKNIFINYFMGPHGQPSEHSKLIKISQDLWPGQGRNTCVPHKLVLQRVSMCPELEGSCSNLRIKLVHELWGGTRGDNSPYLLWNPP